MNSELQCRSRRRLEMPLDAVIRVASMVVFGRTGSLVERTIATLEGGRTVTP